MKIIIDDNCNSVNIEDKRNKVIVSKYMCFQTASSAPDLQAVTDVGQITTHDIVVGSLLKNTRVLSATAGGNVGILMHSGGQDATMLFNPADGVISFNHQLRGNPIATPTADGDYITKGYFDSHAGVTEINDLTDAIYNGRSLFLGEGSGVSETFQRWNTGVGKDVMPVNISGTENVAIGVGAGAKLIADSNVLIGAWVAPDLTTGIGNIIVGKDSGDDLETGDHNTLVGFYIRTLPNSKENVVVGRDNQSYGDANIILGDENIVTGSNNIIIGNNEDLGTADNKLIISNVVGGTATPLIYGEFDNKKLIFNTAVDLAQLAEQPTGAVDLAIATTKYVDDHASTIPDVTWMELLALTDRKNGNRYHLTDADPYTGATGYITMLSEDWFYWVDATGLVHKISANYYDYPLWTSGLIMDGLFTIIVRGTGEVDWGDGSALESYDSTGDVTLTHTYSAFDGEIKFYGSLTKIYNNTSGSDLHHDIGQLPSGLTTYRNTGNNTTSGDIGQLPSGLTTYYNAGSNTVSDYTSPHTFNSSISLFSSITTSGIGLDATEVDNLLIDLDTSGMATGTIELTGGNAPRTSASDTAVANLTGRGVTVATN